MRRRGVVTKEETDLGNKKPLEVPEEPEFYPK